MNIFSRTLIISMLMLGLCQPVVAGGLRFNIAQAVRGSLGFRLINQSHVQTKPRFSWFKRAFAPLALSSAAAQSAHDTSFNEQVAEHQKTISNACSHEINNYRYPIRLHQYTKVSIESDEPATANDFEITQECSGSSIDSIKTSSLKNKTSRVIERNSSTFIKNKPEEKSPEFSAMIERIVHSKYAADFRKCFEQVANPLANPWCTALFNMSYLLKEMQNQDVTLEKHASRVQQNAKPVRMKPVKRLISKNKGVVKEVIARDADSIEV